MEELSFGWRQGLGGGNTFIDTSGADLDLDTWYFVAVDKDASGKIRIYRGEAGGHADMVGSDTPADSSFDIAGDVLKIGEIGLFGSNDLSGWVDEIRITKGIARYASDSGFTPPTRAFPR